MNQDKFFIGGEWVDPAGSDHARGDLAAHRRGHRQGPRGHHRRHRPRRRRRPRGVRQRPVAADDARPSAPTSWPRISAGHPGAATRRSPAPSPRRSARRSRSRSWARSSPPPWCSTTTPASPGVRVRGAPPGHARADARAPRAGRRRRRASCRGTCRCSSPSLKLGPALASGSTIVLKPAPETPLDAYLLAEIARGGRAARRACVNIVPAGREVGEHLVTPPRHRQGPLHRLDRRRPQDRRASAASSSSACTLELGGKSAAIILDDADLDADDRRACMPDALMNNGQACVAQTRILAAARRYDEVVDALAEARRRLEGRRPARPGDRGRPARRRAPARPGRGLHRQGPATRAPRVVVGGGRPAGLDKGWYVEPTVFADVDNTMTHRPGGDLRPGARRSSPTTTTTTPSRIANDSDYGLSGSVWTADVAGRRRRRPPGAHRHLRRQRHRHGLHVALRRLQELGPRPRARPRGPRRVPRVEDHRPAPGLRTCLSARAHLRGRRRRRRARRGADGRGRHPPAGAHRRTISAGRVLLRSRRWDVARVLRPADAALGRQLQHGAAPARPRVRRGHARLTGGGGERRARRRVHADARRRRRRQRPRVRRRCWNAGRTRRRIGVGHSAGALLTVVQQARHHTYDALGLFGFGRGGHEQFALTQEERDQAGGIVELTRQRFGDPLPGGGSTITSPFLLGGHGRAAGGARGDRLGEEPRCSASSGWPR